jgi:hypothetical protein
VSVSWIPSEAVEGLPELPFAVGAADYDDPPPETVSDLAELATAGAFRFANELRAYIDVEGGRIVDYGHLGRGHLAHSEIDLPGFEVVFESVPMPDLRPEPEIRDYAVRFVQTAGGRTGVPAPRRVRHPPYVQLAAPLAWTTLALTIRSDGSSDFELAGASSFPRHWVYDSSGQLKAKSGLIDFEKWYREAFGRHTPWGDRDSRALVAEVETACERQLSQELMQGSAEPEIRDLDAGEMLVRQGEPGQDLFLLLDGLMHVEVDGQVVAEVAPGAILGERALFEGGVRTSTLIAATDAKVAVAPHDRLDRDALERVSHGHRREERQ